MLVLSRRLRESIIITASNGERITVSVERIKINGSVQLGFVAERGISIMRSEVVERSKVNQTAG